jgi:DNA primase
MSLNKPTWRCARSICIVKTLAKPGHYTTRKAEKEAWFLSSLRSETQASFNVSVKKNLWDAYENGKGGNVIDLVMLLETCSFQDALDFLSGNSISFSFCPEIPGKKKKMKDAVIEIVHMLQIIIIIKNIKIYLPSYLLPP